MYIFRLFDMDDTLILTKTFLGKPSAAVVKDMLLEVDTRTQKDTFSKLMDATGEDLYFHTIDEDGFNDAELDLSDGVYASLYNK